VCRSDRPVVPAAVFGARTSSAAPRVSRHRSSPQTRRPTTSEGIHEATDVMGAAGLRDRALAAATADAVDPSGAGASATGQTPGPGASRRQVRPRAPPGAVRHGGESCVRRQSRDSCIVCFKLGLAVQSKRIGARRGAFPASSSSGPNSLLPCPRTGLSQGLVDGPGGRSRTAC